MTGQLVVGRTRILSLRPLRFCKSSIRAPCSRFSDGPLTGTRVPRNSQSFHPSMSLGYDPPSLAARLRGRDALRVVVA